MSDYFIFDDIDTRNYDDILVYFNEIDTTPKRVGEFIEIPNRNGSFFLDGGRYEDATHTYDIVALSKEDASDLINALASKVGYFRLQDSFNTDEFYSAVFNSEIEPKITKERDKLTFKVTFTRKPQRWLTSGETAVTIGEWRDTETVTGDIVEVENPDEILGVKSLSVALAPIQDLHGYDKPWVGGAGKNKANIDDSENGGINANGRNVIDEKKWRSKSLIPIKSGQAYTLHAIGMAATYLYFYDANGDFISPRAISQTDTVTATSPSNAKYVKWTIFKMDITIADVQSAKVQLEEGSTATPYSPYSNICPISGRTEVKTIVSPTTSASDGRTYTTDLGRTVYGGTLDVVSGELTVTHGIVDMGTLDWRYASAQNVFYVNGFNAATFGAANNYNYICERYVSVRTSAALLNTNGSVYMFNTAFNVHDENYTDVASFKSAISGTMFCYELATPQTYQLTPQQIDLLLGTNHIWADTGDVTLEYGQNPNVIINPTLFESSPLLEIEGYGSIGFNGYEIELENVELGEVQISTAHNHMNSATVTLDTQLLNNSDAIYTQDKMLVNQAISVSKSYYGRITNAIVTSTTNATEATAKPTSHGQLLDISFRADWGDGFVYGTSKTVTSTVTITASLHVGGTSHSATITISFVTAYNGTNRVTCTKSVTWTGTGGHYLSNMNTSSTIPVFYGDSSESALGHPTYIDCDLGECYLINGGEIVSLNQHIDLGSQLPTLASGNNTITYDNTITSLKVTPRWWKV